MNPAIRIYSLELAQRALALVRPIVEDLVEARSRWDAAIEDLVFPAGGEWRDPLDPGLAELSRLHDEIDGYRWELEELGLQVLDYRFGEVGFPARLEGRLVLLSWRLGEEEIRGWRPLLLSQGEKGPWYPLSSSPACKAWVQEDWEGPPEPF